MNHSESLTNWAQREHWTGTLYRLAYMLFMAFFPHALTLCLFIYWKHACAQVIRVRYICYQFSANSISNGTKLYNRHVMRYSLIFGWMEHNRIDPNGTHLNCKQISICVYLLVYVVCKYRHWLKGQQNINSFCLNYRSCSFLGDAIQHTSCLFMCMQFAWMNHSEMKWSANKGVNEFDYISHMCV